MRFWKVFGGQVRPRRLQDEPEAEKKKSKNNKIEVYVGSRPELENETQKDAPDLNFARFSGSSWQDLQGFFKGFFRLCERSERSERSDVTPDTTRGRRKLRTNNALPVPY